MAYTFGDASKSIKQNGGAATAAVAPSTYTFGAASQNVSTITPPEPKERSVFGKVAEFVAPTATRAVDKIRAGEDLSARDVIGSVLEVGSFLIPVGAGARVLGLGGKAALSLGRRAAAGAAAGAITGATQQAGTAIGAGEDVAGVVKRAGTGAVVGGAFGGAVPFAARAVGGATRTVAKPFVSRATARAEQEALLKAGAPDSRIATKTLEKGRVVTDKTAAEAVRQGIPEPDVALIKASSDLDKAKMAKMLDVRESQLTNKRVTARATDVVGDTFLTKIAKPIETLNREAGKRLDVVANRLAGKKVDPTSAVMSLADGLENLGIKVSRKTGKLNFKGSAFDGIRSVQSDINNVWNRALRVAKTKDALQAHRAKTYIDQIVEYGAEGKGLKGKASTLLKQFRHNLDAELDSKFKVYNQVNTQFSDTINELSRIGQAMGKTFKIGDTFSDARAGLVMRRILSNTKSRADVLQLLESSQGVLKKYGVKLDEDVIAQAQFADTLEKLLGSEAPTSFLGQIERGAADATEAVSAVGEIGRGNLVRGTLKLGTTAIKHARGITQENQVKALRELLRTKKPTVFGRKR